MQQNILSKTYRDINPVDNVAKSKLESNIMRIVSKSIYYLKTLR